MGCVVGNGYVLFFLKGIALGLATVSPVGPSTVRCVRRSVESGFGEGVLTGLRATGVDTLHAVAGVLAVYAVALALGTYQTIIRLVGGIFLIYLGVRTVSGFSRATGIAIAILCFAGIFAGVGVTANAPNALAVITGFFAGSAFWWVLLSSAGKNVSPSAMLWANRLSGWTFLLFALFAFVAVFLP